MSYSLFIQKHGGSISSNELLKAFSRIKSERPLITFRQTGDGQYDGKIDDVTKCYVSLDQGKGTVEISSNLGLGKAVDYLSGLISEAVEGEVFNPQTMKVETVEIGNFDFDSIKPTEEEKESAKQRTVNEYRDKAIKVLYQIEMGLFDFENDRSILNNLTNNFFGPVTIPVVKRNDHKEKFDLIRSEFKDKFEIDLNPAEYVLVRLDTKMLGSSTYMAFKKP